MNLFSKPETKKLFPLTAILDLKTKRYGYVQTNSHIADAERLLESIVSREDNDISRYPQDFSLYQIGSYDPDTALIIPIHPPVLVRHAIDFKQS